MNLGDKVHVVLEVTGEVVGRTFEQDPKVDLKLPWGMLNGLPMSLLKQVDTNDDVPDNVTQIRHAARKHRRNVRAAG